MHIYAYQWDIKEFILYSRSGRFLQEGMNSQYPSLAFVGDLEMIGPRLDIHRFQFGHGHCANKEKCCGTPN